MKHVLNEDKMNHNTLMSDLRHLYVVKFFRASVTPIFTTTAHALDAQDALTMALRIRELPQDFVTVTVTRTDT